jgi:SAM-dependent methyltransferase
VDPSTGQTKAWLDERYRKTDGQGIYFAHQNIYGFRDAHVEKHSVMRYVITFQIIKALAHLRFDNLLDVGGSEGYTAALVREIFGRTVASCDLSEEACKRAREIYGLSAISADIVKLPFDDNSFDVVLISETLEHVPDLESAAREALRVSRKGLVITVPHDPKEEIERNIRNRGVHAHIHCLNLSTFDFLKGDGHEIRYRKMYSPLLRGPLMAVQAERVDDYRHYPRVVVDCYNCLVPVFGRLFGRPTLQLVIRLDDLISRWPGHYRHMLFTVLKDRSCYSSKPLLGFSVRDILDFTVPYLRVAPTGANAAEVSDGLGGDTRCSC